jgi:outer membrane lipoprotein-sorting protein
MIMRGSYLLIPIAMFVVLVSGCTVTKQDIGPVIAGIQDRYDQINDYRVTISSGTSEGHAKQVLRAVKKPDNWKDVMLLSDGQAGGSYEICSGGADADMVWDYDEGNHYVTKFIYDSSWCDKQVGRFFDIFTPLKEILNETKYNVTITIVEEGGKNMVKAEVINKIARVAEAMDTYWFDPASYMMVRHRYEDYMGSITEDFQGFEINEGIPDSEFEPAIGHGMQVRVVDTTQKIANAKNEEKYGDKEVFLVSDADWKDVLTFLPVAVWTDPSGAVNEYPYMIFHVEDSNFDADSIIHFLGQYGAEKVTIVGDYPSGLTDLIKTETGLSDSQINYVAVGGYRSYWRKFESMVYVEDDYESALLASTYASLHNIPLIIQNSSLDLPGTLKESNVILVGSASCPSLAAACDEQYTREELRLKYLEETNTDKIILVNPDDLYLPVNEEFLTEKSASVISDLYAKTSLAAPILASAKHELIVSTRLTNYTGVDSFLEGQISDMQGIRYLTILASPDAIQMTQKEQQEPLPLTYQCSDQVDNDGDGAIDSQDPECHSDGIVSNKDSYTPGNDDESTYQSSIPEDSVESESPGSPRFSTDKVYATNDGGFQALAVGRIFGITISDVSSYVATAIFYEEMPRSEIFSVLFLSGEMLSPEVGYVAYDTDKLLSAMGFTDDSVLPDRGSIEGFDYTDKFYINYIGHGYDRGWENALSVYQMRDDKIWFQTPMVYGDACLTCAYDEVAIKSRLFCSNAMRRGALAYVGNVDVAGEGGDSKNFLERMAIGRDIGNALKDAHNMGFVFRMDPRTTGVLIGDPTISMGFQNPPKDSMSVSDAVDAASGKRTIQISASRESNVTAYFGRYVAYSYPPVYVYDFISGSTLDFGQIVLTQDGETEEVQAPTCRSSEWRFSNVERITPTEDCKTNVEFPSIGATLNVWLVKYFDQYYLVIHDEGVTLSNNHNISVSLVTE